MNLNNLQETFIAFREQCIWLQTCFDTYTALYESGEDTENLMLATAPHFFHDLNLILIEYCFLQICKLTDPARSLKRDNLTVKHISELLEKEKKLTRKISQASDGIASYRDLIVDSRNKIISHADKDVMLKDGTLGEHQRDDVTQFFKCLYSYVDEVGNALGVGPLDFRSTYGSGDVFDLIRYLKAGLTSGGRRSAQ